MQTGKSNKQTNKASSEFLDCLGFSWRYDFSISPLFCLGNTGVCLPVREGVCSSQSSPGSSQDAAAPCWPGRGHPTSLWTRTWSLSAEGGGGLWLPGGTAVGSRRFGGETKGHPHPHAGRGFLLPARHSLCDRHWPSTQNCESVPMVYKIQIITIKTTQLSSDYIPSLFQAVPPHMILSITLEKHSYLIKVKPKLAFSGYRWHYWHCHFLFFF